MEKNSKTIYRVIIIVLIIIIILLSFYAFKKYDMYTYKSPNSTSTDTNIDIFELICETKDNNCDCTVSDSVGKDTTDEDTYDVTPGSTGITIESEKKTWNQVNRLKIFENSTFVDGIKIAPGTSGTYQFVVRNSSSVNVKYNIKMLETNVGAVNMKYRLKKNGSYISGNNSSWVSYDALDFSDLTLNYNNDDEYILEWKWLDSDNDTINGINTPEYKLEINIQASSM